MKESSTRFKFSCAQNQQRQRDSKKIAELEKQRAKLPMFGFDCHGWLHITIDGSSDYAGIHIVHQEDHVPYCVVSFLENVKDLILKGSSKTVSQVMFMSSI
jgi:hypothetical protein